MDVRLSAFASTILAGIQVFFAAAQLRLRRLRSPGPVAGWVWVQSAAAVSGDGDPSSMLYLEYVGFSIPFAFALGALMRYPGEMDPHYAAMDDGDVAVLTWVFLAHWAIACWGGGGIGAGTRWRIKPDAVAD